MSRRTSIWLLMAFAVGALWLARRQEGVCRSAASSAGGSTPVFPEEGSGRSIDIPINVFSPRQRPRGERNPVREFGNAIADVVERVMPSVVVIRTEKIAYKVGQNLFGLTYRVPEQLRGEGSGVFIDRRGHLLTSWHVVAGAKQVEVVLNDERKLPARLVGFDRAADLAVLKVEGRNGEEFVPVEFGDSDAVRVGEVAIAIGSPFSLQSSVTVGHVSQKGRRVQILPYEDFIQTDAAINEGNSGGPLIDADGRMIGITTAKKTDEQRKGVGIGFAVPSNLSMVVAKSIIETGKHEWPWVGAFFATVSPEYRKDVLGGAGVVTLQVWRDTPAAKAGLLPGDVVMKVNGLEVVDEHDVEREIYNHSVGESVRFSVLRPPSKRFEVSLPLVAYPGPVD